MPRKVIRLSFGAPLLALLVVMQLQPGSSHSVPNKYRYAKNDKLDASYVAEQVSALPHQDSSPTPPMDSNHYRINRDLNQEGSEQSLDDEDRNILDKFYRETRHQDPFQDDSFSSQSLWDDERDQDLNSALGDLNQKPARKPSGRMPVPSLYQHEGHQISSKKPEIASTSSPVDGSIGWTIDPALAEQAEKLTNAPANTQQADPMGQKSASYSPVIKLLTLYDPVNEPDTIQSHTRRNRVVGATLFGQEGQSKLSVESKLPVEAIKLHDELLEEPPKDGKVRVRMYFHRAIHDDVKLYGTGPWKYWGHGWGVEFGYDPKKDPKKDFYQKGYTIERAYGRDFCRDQKNCRPPDPAFFKTQQRMGKI